MDKVGLLLILIIFGSFIPGVFAASPNDACFAGGCHSSSGPTINRSLYDSNPHMIINCIECHVNSTDNTSTDHGKFIRQLNGSKITGPLTTSYYSQNFSLCYFCHNETKVVGMPPGFIASDYHVNPIITVSSIGTNFINTDPSGYHNGSPPPGLVFDIPTNIHWNHLDAFGSVNYGVTGKFDSSMNGTKASYQSCPACHNVHGTNYPKMTKNDLAITYGSDANGTFGYIGSDQYLKPGGDLYCNACHTSGTTFKYYRNEINLYEDCVSCHVDGVPGNVNRTAFSQGAHVNINKTGGNGVVNNFTCWTCHYNRDMNRSNIWQCNDCHTGAGKPAAPQAPILRTHISGVKITNYSCVDCHSKVMVDPGTGIPNVTSHYLMRPTVPTVNYCDYCHGPNATSPFPALNKTIPSFNHKTTNASFPPNPTCRTCHSNSIVSADPLANDTSSFHELSWELGDVFNGTTKADCVICHVKKDPQFVAAPSPPHDTTGMVTQDCYGCHGTNVVGTQAQKLHNPTPTTTGGCIACHTANNASRYYVNTSLFARHANVNTSDGIGNVTDDDCKTCHYGAANGTMSMISGAANSSNTYFCQDCHTSAGTGPIKPTDPSLIKNNFKHGLTNCQWCHIAGDSQPRPLSADLRYHNQGTVPSDGPKGTAAGKNCLTCHVNANLPDLPFHAPGEGHATTTSTLSSCVTCHQNVDNHIVQPVVLSPPITPTLSSLKANTPVTKGTTSEIMATVTASFVYIAAAQYQVINTSGVVIDWTNMTSKDGKFNSMSEIVNASIDTTNLLGTYTINIKGMASAPKTDPLKPYYPLNGQWNSGIYSTQLIVTQPTGNATGTVKGTLGNNLSGAIVSTNTTVSTITDANGLYLLTLPIGTYRLTASKEPEYYSNSSFIVNVTAFSTVTQDIILTLKPTGNITGIVRNK